MIPGDSVIVSALAGNPIFHADEPGAGPQAGPVSRRYGDVKKRTRTRRYTPARSSARAGAAYQSFLATTFGEEGSAR